MSGNEPNESTWNADVATIRAAQPKSVLFMCVANSARSQMAEGIARNLAPSDVRIQSAGSEPSRVNPFALRALSELGIDGADQSSKGTDEVDGDVDVVITLCAEEVCPAWLGQALRIHWPLPDPAAATGSDEQVLASFRAVRQELERRLSAVFGG